MAKSKRKRTAAKRKPVKRKKRRSVRRPRRQVASVKKRPARRKRRTAKRKIVRQVERKSVERVMAGKRTRKRRKSTRRRVVMAGSRRRRVSGEGGGSKMLIGLAIGAAAIYFLTKKSTPTYPANFQLPPLTQTGSYTRNTQSQELVNYAMAGGLAIDAIVKLIDRLNNSSDQEVENIYDVYQTTGTQGLEYYV